MLEGSRIPAFADQSAELGNNNNLADNSLVECVEVFGRYPIFKVFPPTSLLDRVAIQKFPQDLKSGHVACPIRLDVPVPGDLSGIALIEYRIEDRLFWQAGWKGAVASLRDETQLSGADGAPENYRRWKAHRVVDPPSTVITDPVI